MSDKPMGDRYRCEWRDRDDSSFHTCWFNMLPPNVRTKGWDRADWIIFDTHTGEVVGMGNDYFKVAVHLGMKEAAKL